MMSTTPVTASAALTRIFSRLARVERRHVEVTTARNFGGDNGFVAGDFVRIDFTVVIDVKEGEESFRILLHLKERQPAIMVRIRPVEPVGEGIAAVIAERLSHRTDEHGTGMQRNRLSLAWRGRQGEKRDEQHHEGEEARSIIARR
jgi:hypothetical protein